MNIAMFTNTYLPHVGGVARSVDTFAADLRKLGHQVVIICPTFPGAEDSTAEILRVPAIQNFNGSDFSVRLPVPNIIDARLDKFGPELIHSHHPFFLGDAALRAARERGLPIVFTHHTLYEKYTHYVPLRSDKLKRFATQLSTEYANLCDHVIVPSASVEKLLRKRGVETDMTEIPTGVDLDFFRHGNRLRMRKELNLSEDIFLLGHLGRLAQEKNLTYLANAVISCLKQQQQVHFLVVGDGPFHDFLHEQFCAAAVRDRIHMPGKKTGADLADAYAAMDLFVFASKSETQGMVLAEAMAASRPVVGLDASGVREVIIDGKNGRLLPEDASEESFAEVLLEIIAQPKLLHKYREGTSKTAEDFSRQNSIRALAEVYSCLLAEYESDLDSSEHKINSWESLLASIRTEWDLLSEKSSAFVSAVMEDPDTEAELE